MSNFLRSTKALDAKGNVVRVIGVEQDGDGLRASISGSHYRIYNVYSDGQGWRFKKDGTSNVGLTLLPPDELSGPQWARERVEAMSETEARQALVDAIVEHEEEPEDPWALAWKAALAVYYDTDLNSELKPEACVLRFRSVLEANGIKHGKAVRDD